VATPLIIRVFGELLYSGVSAQFDPASAGGVVAGVAAMIVVFTLVPSWSAGRTSTVQAISARHQSGALKPSRLAQAAIRLRLPHVAVFGMKDVFARKTRAWLTIAGVAVVAAIVMMTLTLFGVLDRLVNDPVSMGAWPSELRVERLAAFGTAEAAEGYFAAGIADPISEDQLVTLIESRDEVDSYLTSWYVGTRVEEIDSVISTFIIDGPVDQFGFRVTEGRMFSAPNEAAIGVGLAHTFGLEVGDQVTVLAPLRTQLTIVGKYVDATNNGSVLMYGSETLPALDAGAL
jgi:hypothetical protein